MAGIRTGISRVRSFDLHRIDAVDEVGGPAGRAGESLERVRSAISTLSECRAGGGARDRPEAASAWITVGFRVDVADDLADKGKHTLESTNGGGDNV